MFAVIDSGGKQYHVEVGKVIKLEKLDGVVGEVVRLTKVLSVCDKFGQPYLADALVEGTILEHKKTDKVIIFKKKRRHNYRRKRGHRQNITVVRINAIKE